ncbi:hypothetical protein [Nocardia vermiculata]|uniref:Uncharacterized protein n=1 Tax=Nocardia vermiculata TaxID=257274 RepID=A0A846XXW5_9NOCA|nr:hypothetical protein [Nocardia vermiculata]NKY50575.1 hypothetical protein [Nocardia vermiculata]
MAYPTARDRHIRVKIVGTGSHLLGTALHTVRGMRVRPHRERRSPEARHEQEELAL